MENKAPTKREETAKEKRGEKVEFKDITHVVTDGIYKSFKGIKIEDPEGYKAKICLMQNVRGDKMKESRTIEVDESQVRELDSDDMIGSIDTVGQESEDKELIEHEQGSWECQKVSVCCNIIVYVPKDAYLLDHLFLYSARR